jgi:hypothetical protein
VQAHDADTAVTIKSISSTTYLDTLELANTDVVAKDSQIAVGDEQMKVVQVTSDAVIVERSGFAPIYEDTAASGLYWVEQNEVSTTHYDPDTGLSFDTPPQKIAVEVSYVGSDWLATYTVDGVSQSSACQKLNGRYRAAACLRGNVNVYNQLRDIRYRSNVSRGHH